MDSTRYKRMQVVCRDMSCKCVSGMSFQLDTRTVQKCSYAFKEETSLLLILFIFEPSFSYLQLFPTGKFSSVESFFQRLKFATSPRSSSRLSNASSGLANSRPSRKFQWGDPEGNQPYRFGAFSRDFLSKT